MAQTKDGKKIVTVPAHKRGDTKIKTHKRSTPNPPKRKK